MKQSKRRDGLGNLLDACGIHAAFVEDPSTETIAASLAIVEASPRWIDMATSIRTELPQLRVIVLSRQTAELRPVDVRARLRNAIFLILPVTVICWNVMELTF